MTGDRSNSMQPSRSGAFMGRLSLLFSVLIAILVTITVGVWQTLERLEDEANWVTHTQEVETRTESVLSTMGAVQSDAVIYAISGESFRAADFKTYSTRLDDQLQELTKLVADNPVQLARIRAMGDALRERRDLLARLIAARQSANVAPPLPDLPINRARPIAEQVIATEEQLLTERRLRAQATATTTRVLTVVGTALSIVFLLAAFWLVRRTLLAQAAQQRGLADANEQLHTALAESRRLSESMQQLAHFGELLQSCRDVEEVRRGVQQTLPELLPGLGGRLALLNPSQNLLAVGVHWGMHGLIAESVFQPDDCWALRRGQAYPLDGSKAGFVCAHVQWPNPDFPESRYVCIPMAAQGEIIGVLTVDGVRAIEPFERRLAMAVSEQLALALANLRLQDTLRTQSIRDPLTGLFNRRYLDVSLGRELARATRHNLPLAVLMLDIDHFKRFNDSHGHEAGDALLAHFAEVLKRHTRSEDIACRYGGEEFTIVLHEADETTARQRAEQIRVATSEMSVAHRHVQLEHVTVSIGLALFPGDGRTPEDLLRRADGALYAAKKAGRNRVLSAAQADASTTET
ncbi:MAG TPA: diguanylate cyclase [Xanthomonadaceae bacterium]|jgi:diguanylate cyclase (GGDEF)-like protein